MPVDLFKSYRHAPPHLFRAGAIYMLTAHIYDQHPLIEESARKEDWATAFLRSASIYRWTVHAWVVLDTHYHVIVQAPKEDASGLPRFVSSYHKYTGRKWNQEDQTPGRRVWWNYWDTCVKSEIEYRNRMNYIYRNPVKHGAVNTPSEYRFISLRSR